MRSRRVSLSGIHMRPSYISNPLFSSYSPSVIFPSRVVTFPFFLRISWISLSAALSIRISLRSCLSISRLMVCVVLAWSTLAWLSIQGTSKASLGNRIRSWFCRCFIHQEKKSASGRTGGVRTHQVLRTLWTHSSRTHTAPNAKRTGNVNSDAARYGTVHSDTVCQGAIRLDAACHGICLPDGACQGIFLLDASVSGYFPSGRSCVRAFSF